MMPDQTALKNEQIKTYAFLKDMYEDDYFPKFLVDKGKTLLINLCAEIEAKQPQNLEELYALTHTTTEAFNELEEEFEENDSEIETVARECIALDFESIAQAYSYTEADGEDLIAPRNW
jgi:Family of unknown function (DUF5713)